MSEEVRICTAHNTPVKIMAIPNGNITMMVCEHTCNSEVFECNHHCAYAIGIQMGAMMGIQMSSQASNFNGPMPIPLVMRLGANLGVKDYTVQPAARQPVMPAPVKAAPAKVEAPKMVYFEIPKREGDGICSDNSCPCGYPGATIPHGKGYLYISKTVVDFRKDALTMDEAVAKMQEMEQASKATVFFDQNVVTPTLMCEQGARKRGLDLKVAAADAAYWWETGLVPLRETPLAGQNGAATAARSAATPAASAEPVRQAPLPAHFKTVAHILCIGIPASLLALLVAQSSGNPFIFMFLSYTLTTALFYWIAGGFEWKEQKMSVLRIVLYMLFGVVILSVLYAAVWFLTRFVMAKLYKIPTANAFGRMLAFWGPKYQDL